MTTTSTVTNAVDTYVESDHPGRNYAETSRLVVDDTEAISFVYFGIPFPDGATIHAATLTLYTKESWGGASPTISVRRAASRYRNSKVTWDSAPGGAGATATLATASTGDADPRVFDVAAIMQAVADGADWYGFRITSDAATERKFRSSNANDYRPVLEVEWSEAPDAPTTLSPVGVVGIAAPVLEADYTDASGTGELAGVQAHLKTLNTGWTKANGYASPDFDSGEVASTDVGKARLDLAATAYAGLADTASTFWTFRVKGDDGVWSEWAEPVSFTRHVHPTLAIASPSAGTPTVEDFTPPTVWTYTGTATKHRVTVYDIDPDADGEDVLIYDSGEVPGTGLQETIEDADGEAVLYEGGTFLDVVEVWDDKDRVVTATDSDHVTATREFTVVPVAGVTGVTGMTGAATTPRPGYAFSFDRASAPDFWTMTLDGKVHAANIEPADLFVSGTTYTYEYPGVAPGSTHTFGVHAIVNDQASEVDEITDEVHVTGCWLISNRNTDRHLFLADTAGSDFTETEDAVTHYPLGASKAVRITQAVRDHEGTVEGVIGNYAGKTLAEWRDIADEMKARPGDTYTLVIGSKAAKVVIGDLQVRPTGDGVPTLRSVAFNFWPVKPRRRKAVV